MTLDQALDALRALGSDKMRAQNRKGGTGDNQFGVKKGDIRTMAARIKSDHTLALDLWATGNFDARLLAVLLMDPAKLSAADMAAMVQDATDVQLADWFNGYVLKAHADKESLRLLWLDAPDPMLARAGWSLTNERILKSPDGLDLPGLLDRIGADMPGAASPVQWTMNFCLAAIGINVPALRERALAMGEAMGEYRDFPVSKGCTSPYAPVWIIEMVRRLG